MKKIFPLLLTSVFCWMAPAPGEAIERTTCYKFEISSGPDSSSVIALTNQIWCYQGLVNPAGAKFIYNADGDTAKPELAMIVEPDGMVTHGSLVDGDVSSHRIHARQYNPFPVPVEEPLRPGVVMIPRDDKFNRSLQDTLNLLLSSPSRVEELALQEGHFVLAAKTPPWHGFWWPYKGQPLGGGSDSPLGKYDRYVRARTGSNPGAASWEVSRHGYKGVWWEGHCNGWAASSILRKEPRRSVKDSMTGIVFTPVDQKGLLAETDYCVKYAFFGGRYRGRGDDIWDIGAAEFHKTLTYYLGALEKPVAIDYRRDSAVDNNVVSKMVLDVKKTGSRTFFVSAVLTIHKYDGFRSSTPGVAPAYKRTYKYSLTEDESGNIVSGTWSTTNPDFLWVPLAPTDCEKNNPRLKSKTVEEILAL